MLYFTNMLTVCISSVSTQTGWLTLQNQFNQLLQQNKGKKGHDNIYDNLKTAVMEESLKKHEWDEKAEESLVSKTRVDEKAEEKN